MAINIIKNIMKNSDLISQVAKNSAKVRKIIVPDISYTPLISSRVSPSLFFKSENFQMTGSFKVRGALSKISQLPTNKDIITASSGNHGIACSYAAKIMGYQLTVVLPKNVSRAKLEKIRSYGTKTLLNSGDSGLAEKKARQLAASDNYTYVSPYNDEFVIAGQGTIGFEILEQLPKVKNVFISMGGGGLISGIGSVIKSLSSNVKIIGVSAVNSAALAASIKQGKVVETEHLETLADGCAGGVDDDSITLPIASKVIDRIIHCSEQDIMSALKLLAWDEKVLVEGAAALALAGYLKHEASFNMEESVVLLCGANFDRVTILDVIR